MPLVLFAAAQAVPRAGARCGFLDAVGVDCGARVEVASPAAVIFFLALCPAAA